MVTRGEHIRSVALWLLIMIAIGGIGFCAWTSAAQAGGYGGEENGGTPDPDPEPGPDTSPDPGPAADPDPGPAADDSPDVGPDGDSPNQERCEGRRDRFWKPHTDPCPPLKPRPKPEG